MDRWLNFISRPRLYLEDVWQKFQREEVERLVEFHEIYLVHPVFGIGYPLSEFLKRFSKFDRPILSRANRLPLSFRFIRKAESQDWVHLDTLLAVQIENPT